MDSSFSDDRADNRERRRTSSFICDTEYENRCNMDIGFVAENRFYRTYSFDWIHNDIIYRCSVNWIDGDRIFRAHICSDDVNAASITITFKYDSIQRISINHIDDNSDIVETDIVFVVKHNPIFKFRIWNHEMGKFENGRCSELDNIFGTCWKDLTNATAFKITYKLEKSKFYSWKRKLLNRVRCIVTLTTMIYEEYHDLVDPARIKSVITRLPPKAKYNVECIRSLGTVGSFLLDYYLFKRNDIEMLEELEGNQELDLIAEYFALMFKFLKRDISLTFLDFNPNRFHVEPKIDTRYVPIKTAIVTPTKILFEIEEDIADNRGFRKLGHEKFLLVKFVDEDGMLFPRDERLLHDKMFSVLSNGISVAEQTYFDFGSSSSLFRQHGTYFYEANSQQEVINTINELGVFKSEPAAKVAARVGLYFSSATEIKMKLRRDQIGPLEDIVTSPKNSNVPEYTFTDGIGIMDISLAQQIQRELNIHYTPSAFQFRCIGCKGMVAIDPYNKDLVSNGGQYLVMFRGSQSKFNAHVEDSKIDFDVVRYSGAAPLKLHQSFTALLSAISRKQGKLKVVEKRLCELFNQSIIDILQTLYDPKAFAKALRKLPKHFPINISNHSGHLIKQDFLRSVVEVNAVNLCRQLSSKCHIRIPESLGRQALGVVDEYDLLKPGEIFFQYTDDLRSKSPNPSKVILVGPVGVTKSPMYHLGDVRYLEAVDYPELHHHVDVIVFSRRGIRPIPDQIGGGDLDGDSYDLFWDQILLMEHFEPSDFSSPDSNHLQKVTIQDLHLSHASFRVDYVLGNNIDKISNCFLSHITLHHPDHREIRKLSEKADVAVNSFKSGLFAEPVSSNEEPIFNPNFLNKRHEPMFDSDHILSQLHKRIMRIYLMMQVSQDDAQERRRAMKSGKNIFPSIYAKKMFEDYCYELTYIMNKFGIKTEAELFANIILEPLGSFNTFKSFNKNEEKRMDFVQKQLSNIIKQFRMKILNRFKVDWLEDMYQRKESLSTYTIPSYQISNEMRNLAHEFHVLAQNSGKFLSFPYLIVEALDSSICNKSMHHSGVATIVDDFLNLPYDILSSDQDESMTIEEKLIGLSFLPSSLEENGLHERIFAYPPFTISVPVVYSNAFKKNYEILKELSGCRDIAIRLRKHKYPYHHYSIICEGPLKSCTKLEEMLTPYLEFDESMTLSLADMKRRKTKAMQNILDNIEIFGFSELPEQIRLSLSGPIRRHESFSEERESRRCHPYSKSEKPPRKRRSSWP